jgi:hypothetical protein
LLKAERAEVAGRKQPAHHRRSKERRDRQAEALVEHVLLHGIAWDWTAIVFDRRKRSFAILATTDSDWVSDTFQHVDEFQIASALIERIGTNKSGCDR